MKRKECTRCRLSKVCGRFPLGKMVCTKCTRWVKGPRGLFAGRRAA